MPLSTALTPTLFVCGHADDSIRKQQSKMYPCIEYRLNTVVDNKQLCKLPSKRYFKGESSNFVM